MLGCPNLWRMRSKLGLFCQHPLSPIFFRLALHRRRRRVLELEPVPRAAADIRRAQALRHDAPSRALWRTVSPNASLDASCRRLGFDIGFLCYTLGKLGPALTEEGRDHVVVADPANGFGRACGLPEAAAEGLALHQRARGHKGALATRPAGALRRRADAVATDQHRAVEVEIVPIGADRAAGVDSRPLERDRVLLEQIGRHAQALGANDFAGRDIAGGWAALLLRHTGSGRPRAQARRERHRCEQESMSIPSSAHARGSMA